MRYRISHTTKYTYSDTVSVCHNLVRLTPRTSDTQKLMDRRLVVSPEPAGVSSRIDWFGNQLEHFSIQDAHRGLSLTATSEVEVHSPRAPDGVGDAWESVRDDLVTRRAEQSREYLYTLRSPRTPIDSKYREYASPSFPAGRPILQAARDLTARIHADFEYRSGATHVDTPLEEAFQQRVGVCQDFAHLQIACCRSMGLAARYVSGYLRTHPPEGKPRLLGADESHAWVSLWCGKEGWVEFDPTNDCIPSIDHITLAYGRDYSDVAPVQGVFLGGGSHTVSVSVDVAPIDDEPPNKSNGKPK